MSRIFVSTTMIALALTPALAGAQSAPVVTVHPIFSGGAKTFHVGAVVQVLAKGKPALEKICFSPAPIDRPACSTAVNGAPSKAGITRITVTTKSGATATKSIRVLPAAKKLGGNPAIPGHVTCHDLPLFGSPRVKAGRQLGMAGLGDNVALYNRVDGGRFVWVYATNQNGFADAKCLARGLRESG
jgi:hypothetical protein